MDASRILELLRPLVLVCDRDGFIRQASGAFGGFAGRTADEYVGQHPLDLVSDDDAEALASVFLQAAERDDFTVAQPIPFVVHVIDPSGHPHAADAVGTGVLDGDEPGWVVVLTPHSQQTLPVGSLVGLLDGAPLGEVIHAAIDHLAGPGDDDRRLAAALVADRVDGLRADEVAVIRTDLPLEIGDGIDGLYRAEESPIRFAEPLAQLRAVELPTSLADALTSHGFEELIVAQVDVGPGEVARLVVANGPARDPLPGNVAQLIDRTAKLIALALQSDRELRSLAHASTHDPLTGLGNRRRLHAQLRHRDPATTAALFVDLDRFKAVNDRHGHRIGDLVLATVGRRLVSAPGPAREACRVGGDEFVVLVDTDPEGASADQFAETLRAAIAEPLQIDGGPEQVTASIGVALGRAGRSFDDLIAEADADQQLWKRRATPDDGTAER